MQAQSVVDGQSASTVRVNTRLVEVNVIVTDKHGKPLAGLTQNDFSVFDEGRPEQIRVFSSATNVPSASAALPPDVYTNRIEEKTHVPASVTVILLDALNTEAADQTFAQKQVLHVLDQLQPQEYVALYWLGNELRVLHEFTTDVATLRRVLDGLDSKASRELDNSELADPSLNTTNPSTPLGQAFERQVFRLAFDQRVANQSVRDRVRHTVGALGAIANHLRTRAGRKNLIWVSSSFPINLGNDSFDLNWTSDTGEQFGGEVAQAAQALTDADIAVYPVDARGLLGTDNNAPGDDLGDEFRVDPADTDTHLPVKDAPATLGTMQTLAERTGGKAFYGTNGIGSAIRRALDDARVTYTLGYYPADVKWDGRFHEIKVKVSAAGAEVRARKGYFALPGSAGLQPRNVRLLISQLAQSELPATGIGLHVRTQPAGDEALTVEVHLDLHEIRMQQKDGRWTGTVQSVFLQLDRSGKILQVDDRTFHPEFIGPTYEQALQAGISDSRRVRLVKDAAEVCVVERDGASGNLGSIYVPAPKKPGGSAEKAGK
jgi:VWFA-related protein